MGTGRLLPVFSVALRAGCRDPGRAERREVFRPTQVVDHAEAIGRYDIFPKENKSRKMSLHKIITEAGTRFYAACHSINEERNALPSSADRGTDAFRTHL
jgi:hypothetical protein